MSTIQESHPESVSPVVNANGLAPELVIDGVGTAQMLLERPDRRATWPRQFPIQYDTAGQPQPEEIPPFVDVEPPTGEDIILTMPVESPRQRAYREMMNHPRGRGALAVARNFFLHTHSPEEWDDIPSGSAFLDYLGSQEPETWVPQVRDLIGAMEADPVGRHENVAKLNRRYAEYEARPVEEQSKYHDDLVSLTGGLRDFYRDFTDWSSPREAEIGHQQRASALAYLADVAYQGTKWGEHWENKARGINFDTHIVADVPLAGISTRERRDRGVYSILLNSDAIDRSTGEKHQEFVGEIIPHTYQPLLSRQEALLYFRNRNVSHNNEYQTVPGPVRAALEIQSEVDGKPEGDQWLILGGRDGQNDFGITSEIPEGSYWIIPYDHELGRLDYERVIKVDPDNPQSLRGCSVSALPNGDISIVAHPKRTSRSVVLQSAHKV